MNKSRNSNQRNPLITTDEEIKRCIQEGANQYFEQCRQRVPQFISRHFLYPGAWHTNRVAFGWDLLRAPLNLFWAPVYALICILRFALKNFKGLHWLVALLEKTSSGMTTQVQKNISELISRDLFLAEDTSGLQLDLKNSILNALQKLYRSKTKSLVQAEQFQDLIEPLLQEALIQYQVTRTASADITNTLSCAVLGAFTFKKFTPGGIGVGIVVATMLAEKISVKQFVFGETLGGFYYSLFPPQPSLTLLSLSMIGVMACLSVVAAFSGVITDPIQARLGLHQKRLNKMLDSLEKDFIESTRSSFRPKDQFIARILDAFDMLKSSLI